MQALEDIASRIDSAEELKTVVSSMKSLANLSIRQYEKSVQSLRDYSETLEQALIILLEKKPDTVTIAEAESGGRAGFLILGSALGMCGPFNDRILDHTLRTIRELESDPDRRELYSVGERVTGRLENQGRTPAETFSLPSSVEGITSHVQDLLPFLDSIRAKRGIQRFWIFYNTPSGETSYDSRSLQLLPIDRNWIRELQERDWDGRTLPKYRGDWEELFRHVMDQYLFVSLFRVYAESLASENAARLQAMGGAEENIKRRLKGLRGDYNRIRQTQITEELLDLTSGYEALNTSESLYEE